MNNLQLNIGKIKGIFVRRKYKDILFQRVFREKEDLLDLYNAINGTNYTDARELEITTLEDAIYISMKNDKSFIFSSTLNLYEHQSTINPNMPIRGFNYFSRLYESYISTNKLNIYGNNLVVLPTPHYIVFYNGRQELPDRTILKLSDSFKADRNSDEFPALECVATVLNINYGHNENTLNACKRLGDYSRFIYEVNIRLDKGLSNDKAINAAMEYCIEHNILADILLKNRSEVMGSILTYTEKMHRKTLKENEEYYKAEIASQKNEIAKRDSEIARLSAELEALKKKNSVQ